MTVDEVASLFHARRAGKGTWSARCLVHGRDRHPSLTIKAGHSAVLLICRSHGCPLDAICQSVGISVGDLWYHRETDPKAIRRAQEAMAKQMEVEREETRLRKLYTERGAKWEAVSGALGNLLFRHPEDDKLNALFHASLSMMRINNDALGQYCHSANEPGEMVITPRDLRGITAADVGPVIGGYLELEEIESTAKRGMG